MGDGISKAVVDYAFEEDIGSPRSWSSSDASPKTRSNSMTFPKDTLIIFDWDDTLLCSSAINMAQWDLPQLQQLERAAEAALQAAMKLGDTMIVTNGNATWVQESSRRFLPGLIPTLEQITVISARAHFEESFPCDPFAWKRACFREILETRRRQRPDEASYDGLNLVVLGDSPAEMEAAHHATKIVGGLNSLVKTVKFKEKPSVPELLGQLRRIVQELEDVVYDSRCTSKMLDNTNNLPIHVDHMTSWASGWKLCEGKSWGGRLSMAEALFMPDADDEILTLDLPKWMVEIGDKVACWQKAAVGKVSNADPPSLLHTCA